MPASHTDSRNAPRDIAWEIIEHTGESLFLTGKAGTGKTTFLRELVKKSSKRLVVLAPTGIAAINAGGVTLHSFFQLPFSPYVPGSDVFKSGGKRRFAFNKTKLNIIRSLDLIIIDEISMVRADMLDAVDAVLRRIRHDYRPFGGVQMLFIGDLQQLPPVVTNADFHILSSYYDSFYFFDSRVLRSMHYHTVELTNIYRQSDARFISLLNAIRENRADASVLAALNERCIPGFIPPDKPRYIRLTTHNDFARAINDRQLYLLHTEPHVYSASVKDEFPESAFPADRELILKEGAQVMFIRNDSSGERRYYNGMLGIVTALSDDVVSVMPDGSEEVLRIARESWDNIRYELDEKTGEIKEHIDGTFSQFPLRLAWAITIHKSQGLTFSHAVIDASRSFAHGQCYVALSRCRSLDGLVIETPLSASAVICDSRVSDYMRTRTETSPDAATVGRISSNYRLALACEMFDFRQLASFLSDVVRIVEEAFMSLYPDLVEKWRKASGDMDALQDVAVRFYNQYSALMQPGADESKLQERIRAASSYFAAGLSGLGTLLESTPSVEDSKGLDKRLTKAIDSLCDVLVVRRLMLEEFRNSDFSVDACLKTKSKAVLALERNRPMRVNQRASRMKNEGKGWGMDMENKELFRRLVSWRRKKGEELGKPLFSIFPNAVLKYMATYPPLSDIDLLEIPGVGRKRAALYGAEILQIVEGWLIEGA